MVKETLTYSIIKRDAVNYLKWQVDKKEDTAYMDSLFFGSADTFSFALGYARLGIRSIITCLSGGDVCALPQGSAKTKKRGRVGRGT